MMRSLKITGGLLLLVGLLGAVLFAYQRFMLSQGRTPEGFSLLTPMPGTVGFEPTALPTAPVLRNRGSTTNLAVAFGYRVGNVSYSYTMQFGFPGKSDAGRADLGVRHGSSDAKSAVDVVRRWDVPREAYAVALQAKFDMQPPVPALCVKTVIGPKLDGFDLQNASICVAQRDAAGTCRPETLACGLIR